MSERVPLPVAAEILGMSKQGVREHMKRGLFFPPIGYVSNPSGRQFQYRIYKNMLEEHIGREKGGAHT